MEIDKYYQYQERKYRREYYMSREDRIIEEHLPEWAKILWKFYRNAEKYL